MWKPEHRRAADRRGLRYPPARPVAPGEANSQLTASVRLILARALRLEVWLPRMPSSFFFASHSAAHRPGELGPHQHELRRVIDPDQHNHEAAAP
jgi:hypothetical protein